MFFIAIKGRLDTPWKALSRRLYRTKSAAISAVINECGGGTFRVFDADHEPGRAILKSRHGFA